MSQTLTTPSAAPDARYVEVGSTFDTWTGASCARDTTRSGCIRFDKREKEVGIRNMRNDREEVNTSRNVEQGDMQNELIDSVSWDELNHPNV